MPGVSRWLRGALFVLLASVALPGAAQGTREAPASALKGKLTPRQLPLVDIDGRTLRLAPGARIYSLNKTMLTPNQVAPDTQVRYELDAQGQVRTVWIVNERSSGERRTGPQQ
jgi:hypothetical protein